MPAEKVMVVDRSRIGERLKLVHPLTAHIVALSLTFNRDTRTPITNASLLADSTQYKQMTLS